MKYIYGPVNSRRLGFSLGLSLTPYKVCNFDCIYCQLGRTTELTLERKEYIPVAQIMEELKAWLGQCPQEAQNLNYITLSGSGEPTLNSNIAVLIHGIKQLTTIPLALITNASLLVNSEIRVALANLDLVVPSLDAVTPEMFAKIDRPHPDLKIEEVINGLIALRKEFIGKIWLEVMLLKGMNCDLRHIQKLKEVIEKINPDKVQLNSPVRCPKEAGVFAVGAAKLKKIQGILGEKCEII